MRLVSLHEQVLSVLSFALTYWVKYFYAVFQEIEIALYDVGSQREFERISFKTLSFMVAFPFSAKRKMTL